MTELDDDQRLMHLAAVVDDGAEVDWMSIEKSLEGEDAESSLVPEFKLLAAVGSIARSDGSLPASDPRPVEIAEGMTWGRLRLENVIGHGSYGTVHKAWDPVLEQHVALKLLHPRDEGQSGDSQRALEEARMLSRINHEGVVRVFGVETHGGRVGLWMELISGRTTDEILRTQGPRSADEARAIGAAVCRALAAVHAAGLVHQDLKAHNVMREQGGRIVLMDLGAGLRLSRGNALWQPGVGGTPLYLAPELFDGHPSSPASDVYSLGVLLFYLATGRYPVEGRHRLEVERAHKDGRRVRLRDARPDLPSDFVRAVERALDTTPGSRYQTAGDFEAALAPPAATRRRPSARLLVGAVFVVCAAAAVISLALNRRVGSSGAPIPSAVLSRGSSTVPAVGSPYRIRAAFWRRKSSGDEPLTAGSRLTLKDTLALKVDASVPVFVYVLNQDEQGNAYLLYPLEDNLAGVGPLPIGETRIPATNISEGWVVNSAGGREHFLIAVSRERLTDFEQEIGSLPRPQLGALLATAVRLPEHAVGILRGVGGLAPAAPHKAPLSPFMAATPLGTVEESAEGAWLRRIAFENP